MMKVHHGNIFRELNGKATYVGGACELIKDCDPVVMSILEFHDIRTRLGDHVCGNL